MTNQNNAAQADAIRDAIRKAYDDGYNDAKMAPDNASTYCVERATREGTAALLSKLRAPVAGEAQPSDAEVLKVYAETVAEYADGRGFEAGTVAFARSLLRRYAAPQASEKENE